MEILGKSNDGTAPPCIGMQGWRMGILYYVGSNMPGKVVATLATRP